MNGIFCIIIGAAERAHRAKTEVEYGYIGVPRTHKPPIPREVGACDGCGARHVEPKGRLFVCAYCGAAR